MAHAQNCVVISTAALRILVSMPGAPNDVSTDPPGNRWGGLQPPAPPSRLRRVVLWSALIALLISAQAALLWLTWRLENARVQEAVDQTAASAAADIRQRLADDIQALQQLLWVDAQGSRWTESAAAQLQQRRELLRLELRDERFALRRTVVSAHHPAQFGAIPREAMLLDAETACATALRYASPAFSRTYFVPTRGGLGMEVVDLCLPNQTEGRDTELVVATVALRDLLEQALPADLLRRHEVLLIEADGTRLARAGARRGAGVYTSERLVDLAGFTLPLRLDSTTEAPSWIANLTTALVIGLGVALSAVLLLLGYDMKRRSAAEQGLAAAFALRKAMEDSLVTGLRARDLQGRITYVNAAFCNMVGFTAEELLAAEQPLYWPPEMAETYTQRQAGRLSGASAPPREGHETVFMRRNGERFPVLIFEAPLVDGRGRHAGWMSSVLDMGPQRRIEELSRQQQEKLQAAARLATMGEMATLLSHELNQPLAAIASYASGSLNLLPAGEDQAPADLDTQLMVRQATTRIAEQADRAGRVIRSVHQFVRRRERLRESMRADELIEAVLPLIRLAARRSHIRVELDLPKPMPRVSCDRTMVEQVLLNLARNGIQAMEDDSIAPADRLLTVRVRPVDARWVECCVTDHGTGIAQHVGERLFTPFFTTKPEGMGIGLAMCRTVVEQHGGALDFHGNPGVRGCTFRFTLPAAESRSSSGAPAGADPGPDHGPTPPPPPSP